MPFMMMFFVLRRKFSSTRQFSNCSRYWGFLAGVTHDAEKISFEEAYNLVKEIEPSILHSWADEHFKETGTMLIYGTKRLSVIKDLSQSVVTLHFNDCIDLEQSRASIICLPTSLSAAMLPLSLPSSSSSSSSPQPDIDPPFHPNPNPNDDGNVLMDIDYHVNHCSTPPGLLQGLLIGLVLNNTIDSNSNNNANVKRICVLGGGGCVVPAHIYTRMAGFCNVEVVENDSEVLHAARRFFGISALESPCAVSESDSTTTSICNSNTIRDKNPSNGSFTVTEKCAFEFIRSKDKGATDLLIVDLAGLVSDNKNDSEILQPDNGKEDEENDVVAPPHATLSQGILSDMISLLPNDGGHIIINTISSGKGFDFILKQIRKACDNVTTTTTTTTTSSSFHIYTCSPGPERQRFVVISRNEIDGVISDEIKKRLRSFVPPLLEPSIEHAILKSFRLRY
jgi:hypothetical protein